MSRNRALVDAIIALCICVALNLLTWAIAWRRGHRGGKCDCCCFGEACVPGNHRGVVNQREHKLGRRNETTPRFHASVMAAAGATGGSAISGFSEI